jgi:hypothetical protein
VLTDVFNLVLLSTLLITLAACESSAQHDANKGGPSTESDEDVVTDSDADTDDTDIATDTNTDSETDTPKSSETEIENEWGFPMRIPGYADLDGPGCEWEPKDHIDWLCTLVYEDLFGVVYIQSDPVECSDENPMPLYETQAALIHIDGALRPLPTARLEVVEHENDAFLDFDFEERHYHYGHSDLADWGTACHPMDCLVVSDLDGEMIHDGCDRGRSLPIVCVKVEKDGSFEPLVDTFEGCAEWY